MRYQCEGPRMVRGRVKVGVRVKVKVRVSVRFR